VIELEAFGWGMIGSAIYLSSLVVIEALADWLIK